MLVVGSFLYPPMLEASIPTLIQTPAPATGNIKLDVEQLKTLIEIALDEDKAEDIVTVPLKGKTDIADYMIIASGRSQRHVASLADKLADRLLEAGVRGVPIEGKDSCDWVLVDAGDIIIHLFRPEIRHHYNLEKMWAVESVAKTPQTVSA